MVGEGMVCFDQRVTCNAVGEGKVLQEGVLTEVNLVGNDDGLRFGLMALEVNRPMPAPTSSQPRSSVRKSKCHMERRNSPSVTA